MQRLKLFVMSLLVLLAITPISTTAQDGPPADTQGPDLDSNIEYYAVLDTSAGKIVIEFYEAVAPKTVRNFVNLSEGTKEFKDAKTNQKAKRPYYDGVIFHRVIPGFMIQGGDPTGTGAGGPGFTIGEEFDPNTNFSEDYLVAMARTNRPGSSAAQFFITDKNSVSRTTHLSQQYTIFGRVVDGKDVVTKIANAPVTTQPGGGEKSRPVEPVVINKVKILRVKKDSGETWKDKLAAKEEKKEEKAAAKEPKPASNDAATTATTRPAAPKTK